MNGKHHESRQGWQRHGQISAAKMHRKRKNETGKARQRATALQDASRGSMQQGGSRHLVCYGDGGCTGRLSGQDAAAGACRVCWITSTRAV
jgi:hypothetical protein